MKQQNPLIDLLGKHIFLNHFGNYELNPVEIHELLSRGIEKLRGLDEVEGLDKKQLQKSIISVMKKNSPNLERYLKGIYRTIPQPISEQETEEPGFMTQLARFFTLDTGKSWVFDFWGEVSKFSRRFKQEYNQKPAMGVCYYLRLEKSKDESVDVNTLFFPNKKRLQELGHGDVWDFYKKSYKNMPERGLKIPEWIDESCGMTKFDLSTRKIQYELIGKYCTGDYNQPCDIRFLGEYLMMFFGELYNKDVFDFITLQGWQNQVFAITSGEVSWTEDVLGNRRVAEWYRKNTPNLSGKERKEKYINDGMYIQSIVGPDGGEAKDPLDWGDISPRSYQRTWLKSYFFQSPTFKAALNESFESSCDAMVSMLLKRINELNEIGKTAIRGQWAKRYKEESNRLVDYWYSGGKDNPSAVLERKLFDEESIEHKNQVEAKFKELVMDFGNYKNHLRSLYDDHYEEVVLDDNRRPVINKQTGRPETKKVYYDNLYNGTGEFYDNIRKSDPLAGLQNVLQNKIEADWRKPIKIGGDIDINRIAKIEKLVAKAKLAVEEKFNNFSGDFDLAKDYVVPPPRRIALMKYKDVIEREYLDDLRPNRARFWLDMHVGGFNKPGSARITRIPPTDAAIKDFRNPPLDQVHPTKHSKENYDRSRWPSWGDLYKQFNAEDYRRIRGQEEYDPDIQDDHLLRPGSHPMPDWYLQQKRQEITNQLGYDPFVHGVFGEPPTNAPLYRGGPSTPETGYIQRLVRPMQFPKEWIQGRPPDEFKFKRKKVPRFNFRAMSREYFAPFRRKMEADSIDMSDPDTYDTSGDRIEVGKYLDNAVKTMGVLVAFETVTTPVLFLTPFKWAKPLPKMPGGQLGSKLTPFQELDIHRDVLKLLDDYKSGAYQTKTFADHLLYPAISAAGQGALRMTGVKALEKKAGDALTTFLSKNELSKLRRMIVWAARNGYKSISGLANVVYQLSVFLAGFVTVYRTFVDMPTAEDLFLKNLGILFKTPAYQYDKITAQLSKLRELMTASGGLYENLSFRDEIDKLLAEIEAIISDAKDDSLLGVEKFKQRYYFYCGFYPKTLSTDEEVKSFLKNMRERAFTPQMKGFLKNKDICGKKYTPEVAKEVVKLSMAELLSRVERLYMSALKSMINNQPQLEGKFELIRTGFDTYKLIANDKFYEEIQAEVENNLSGMCDTIFKDIIPDERKEEEDKERERKRRDRESLRHDMMLRGM